MIVIHTTEGSYQSAINWFQSPNSHVSAHYVTSKAGEITQMVADKDIAWHAGNYAYNQRSIGIENEGYVANNPPITQLSTLSKLVKYLCLKYNIPIDHAHIIGHDDVPNQSPDHHTDPDPNFDWPGFISMVQSQSC